MGFNAATRLNRWVKSAEAKAFHARRLNIGPRLILGFVVIVLSMLAADAIILWQFHVVRTQAGHLNDVDQKLVAVLRVHTTMLEFHDRLDALADAEDANRLAIEAGRLRTMVLEDIRRATSALSLPFFDFRQDPTILPTLHVIQSALPSQLDAITTLAASGDWRAVHLRLENQVRPLESLTSALVETVDHEAAEQQAQTVLNIRRVQNLVFWIVPLTAVFTLLIAATLGLAITRSITQPLAGLVEGSKALARGEFQHQVSITGEDELAHLGQVFNDTAHHLRDLYTTLQRSEDRLRLVIDTIPAYAWSARPDGSVDFINQRFLEFTGLSMKDMLGWDWASLIHPDDLTTFVGKWQAAVATGEPMESEIRVRRMDGDYLWLLIRNVPLQDETGNIVKWYGTAIDIEKRHRAEDALRRSEAYLAEGQRLSHTGSGAWRVAGRDAMYLSEEWYRIYGFDPKEGLSAWEKRLQRMHPDDRSRWREITDRAIFEKSDYEGEHRIVLPDGTLKHTHTVGHPVLNAAGDVELFVCTMMDITERKHAEEAREALRQAQADLARVSRATTMGELTASLAHEVNQPIAAAGTNANTCLRWLAGDTPNIEEARAAATRIVKDVRRAGEIISRIRQLFQKGSSQRELVDVNEIIREMIVLLRGEIARCNIVVGTNLAADLPQVMADRVHLQQVLMNLMINSIEAMKDVDGPRELSITAQSTEEAQLLVSVTDTGVGLPPQQAEHIFNAFFTTKLHGTGMGLRISRSIIESHGGRLWADDGSLRGASFYFTLPTTDEATE